MERKFLEDLGLEKEAVDKIMAQHGKSIERAKGDLEAERDGLQEKLGTVQDALKQFEGVDVQDLNTKIQTLQTDLQKKDTEYQAKLADMGFSSVLTDAIAAAKGKNPKSVIANLNTEHLKSSNNQKEDIAAALSKLKESDPYLFEAEQAQTKVSTGGSHSDEGGDISGNAAMNNLIRKAVKGE